MSSVAACEPLIANLLTHAATGVPPSLGAWGPKPDHERQFTWALAAGLGPLLHRAIAAAKGHAAHAWARAAHGADLAARVRHAQIADTAVDVIQVANGLGIELVLLKGISTGEQFYPSPHCRPMGDIDLLIAEDACNALQQTLVMRGYREAFDDFPADLYHAPPLRHPVHGAVVELHTALFPESSPLDAGRLFAPARVIEASEPSLYRGHRVRRLPAELQLAYAACTWVDDLTFRRSQPGFLASLFDGVYLLSRHALEWDRLMRPLDNPMAAASLLAMLTYIPRFGVRRAPVEVLGELAARQRLLGPVQRRLMHWMLDRYLIAGRPWNLPLPPPMPGRYSVSRQWRKRVLRRP